ncbi:uncharacterized protein LOC108628849 [Ceratina calcarata]|uniref:Uncharacterized protein LOC108628641 n=1 Tax=Ceratina calcarata TaxID=156304 RepID=A0AAJ7NAT6_9HYME|nr:uncharacterized protein LOC108628641 [Ceratina calcarata]XP_017886541.1 uncharacterized protein LOC108628849 [Ceratina calcarata]
MLSTINLYVDKLVLLKLDNTKLSVKDREKLNTICETLNKILKFSIGLSSTRIRKEALNLALSLGKKLQLTNRTEQFNKMITIIQEALPELTKDNEPEIRTRIIDIKEMLKI